MRRLLLLLTLALGLTLPVAAQAQAEPDQEETQPDQEAIEDDGGYEPDQRGVEDEESPPEGGEQAGGDDAYEPDQRGVEAAGEDEPLDQAAGVYPMEADRATLSESGSDEAARQGLGFDLMVFGGLGTEGFQVFGGGNIVRPHQGGSLGGSVGASVGLGYGPLSIGPRVSFTTAEAYSLGAVGLDVNLMLSNGWVAPSLRFAISYAFLFNLADPLPQQNEPGGVWAELALGVRARIDGGPFLLGGEVAGGWLAMFRDAVQDCTMSCIDEPLNLRRSGTSNGATFRLHVFGGVTF